MKQLTLLISLFTFVKCKNMHILASQTIQPEFIQQPNIIQMSSLSLMGSPSANQPPYLELISVPDGTAKILMDHTDGAEGSALRILFNDQVVLSLNSRRLITQAETVSVSNLRFSGGLYYGQQPQWKLVTNEQFWFPAEGWSDTSVSTCGGIHMLGGYGKFAGGEVQKTLSDFPEHKYVKIVANFHFIDAWSGESGFMRTNTGRDGSMLYVWTEKYDYSKSRNGINVCGANYPEGKLTSQIQVSLPHVGDSITVAFGSTLDQDAEENSFGVSNFQIYIL